MGNSLAHYRNNTSMTAAVAVGHRPEAMAARTLEAVRQQQEGTHMAPQKALRYVGRLPRTAVYSHDSHIPDNRTRHTLAPRCQRSMLPVSAISLCVSTRSLSLPLPGLTLQAWQSRPISRSLLSIVHHKAEKIRALVQAHPRVACGLRVRATHRRHGKYGIRGGIRPTFRAAF
jgi:hypothetical protein